MTSTDATPITGERADLLEALAKHRYFLRHTVRELTDAQARQSPTASALCLGGLIKHVAATEQQWVDFILGGPDALGGSDWSDGDAAEWSGSDAAGDDVVDAWMDNFRLLPDETLAGVLEQYDRVARRTDELVASLPDLEAAHPLPVAPWFEAGARWSARRVLLHIIAETSQHAGHADIIRETIDGSRSMG